MKTIAFIPVRGGSKSIPNKNIKLMAGRPLVYWGALAAQLCDEVSEIVVSTDSDVIEDTVNSFGFDKLRVFRRSEDTATDCASTESAMIEFALHNQFDTIILIQATSPMISAKDLSGGMSLFFQDGVDSVLSVVRQKRFVWDIERDGRARAVNYDYMTRPRRQNFDGFMVENGAFYITNRDSLLSSGNRLSGSIFAYEMGESSYVEIDEPIDWLIVEKIMEQKQSMKNEEVINKLKSIKMFLSDCDGCLTDGGMYYTESGDEMKKFCTRDGKAFSILKSYGIITGIITGEDRALNERRAEKMGVDEIIQGSTNKTIAIKELCEKYGVEMSDVLYIGDDLNDLEAITTVGLGCSPADACITVRNSAQYVAVSSGGKGVIREIVDLLTLARCNGGALL